MKIQSFIYSNISKMLHNSFVDLIHFRRPWRKVIFNQIREIKKERNFLLSYLDAYNIVSITKSTNKLGGSIVEVGAFEGASAKLISLHKDKKRSFFVIDSFEGLPEESDIDRISGFKKGAYLSDYDTVKKYLENFENIQVLKGFFPEKNSKILQNESFSFVHLDIDLYEPTKECLAFFYERMMKGGIILTHDYQTPGIRKAFEEFFNDKQETIVELMEHQGMVVKL